MAWSSEQLWPNMWQKKDTSGQRRRKRMGASMGRRRKGKKAESLGWLGIFWLPDFSSYHLELEGSFARHLLHVVASTWSLFLFFSSSLSSSLLPFLPHFSLFPSPFLSSPLCSLSSDPPCLRFLIAWQLGGTLQFFFFIRQLSFPGQCSQRHEQKVQGFLWP